MVPISSKISHSVHAIILYHVTSMLIKFRRIIITFLPLFAVLSFSFLDTVDTKFIFLRSLFGYWPSSYTLLLIEIVFLYISSNLVDSSPRMRPRGIIPLGQFSRIMESLYQIFSEGFSISCCPTQKMLQGQGLYSFNNYVSHRPTIYVALCWVLDTQ